MKTNTPELMKFKRLQRRLQVKVAELCGLLELLWINTAKNAPQGDIGKFTNEEIAIGCYWEGDPDEFITAMVDCGWLDEDETHRLLIHDWKDHCPKYVQGFLARHGKTIISANKSNSGQFLPSNLLKQPPIAASLAETSDPENEAEKSAKQPPIATSYSNLLPSTLLPSQAKPSQAKPSESSSELLSRNTPSKAFQETWILWKRHLSENFTPLTPTAEDAVLMELSRCLPSEQEQIDAIKFSILKRAKHLITNGDHARAREGPSRSLKQKLSREQLFSKIKDS